MLKEARAMRKGLREISQSEQNYVRGGAGGGGTGVNSAGEGTGTYSAGEGTGGK